MNDNQVNKDKATLLQQHLKQDGVTLARSRALNIIAQLNGYRNHTVAKRGKPHAVIGGAAAALVLYSGTYLHPDVEASYVANQGRHCPYCGNGAVHDAMDAHADIALWDVLMACGSCKQQWFAVYTLDRIDGVNISSSALEAAKAGQGNCAQCGNAHVEYSTFVPGREGYQLAHCRVCRSACAHVYRLTGMAEVADTSPADNEDPPRYLVSECWGHLFGPGSSETEVRFVFDRKAERIIAMQAQNSWKWVDCSPAEIADVEDSLKNANADALEAPEDWDLEETCELPGWARPSTGTTA